MTKEEYILSIRRHLRRVQNARLHPDTISLRNSIIQSFFGIVNDTERYTGAQFGTSEMYKPLLLASTLEADTSPGWDFIDALVTAIDERYKMGVSQEDASASLPLS